MSLSILSLQQNGDLQRIKDKWLGSGVCITSSPDPVKMSLHSYASLFYVIGGLYLACLSCLLSRYLRFRRNHGIAPRIIELDPRHPIHMEMSRNGNPYA